MKWTGPGLALLAALAVGAAPASADTTYTVSSTLDQTSGGSCAGTVCTSLRAAVTNVPAGSTIQLSIGIYKLNGFLAVGKSLSITGISPAQTTIQQTKTGDGVIEASTGDLSLSQLTITGGNKQGINGQDPAAGGIYTAGTSLSLGHVSVTGNTATGSSAPGANGGDAIGAIQLDGSTTTLTIAASSITNNSATGGRGADVVPGDGRNGGTAYGAIADFAQTGPTISNSVISNNTATGGTGGTGSGLSGYSGGLSGQADGAMTFIPKTAASTTVILGTTITNNTSIGGQGGKGINSARGGNGNTVFAALSNGTNTLKLVSSTISGNTGTPSAGGTGSTNGHPGTVIGGGLDAESGNLTLINSTVSGNVITGDSEGGGIDMRSSTGKLTLGNDTIFGNSAQQGGNIDAISTQMTLAGTIIAGGVAGPTYSTTANCNLATVTVINLGHNLEGTAPTHCGLSGPNTLVGANPQLASLAANGGLTQTMALGPASPALGAGGACTDISLAGSVPLGVDQRGLPRAAACDIGAFEHQPVAEQAGPTITGSPTFASTLTCSPGTWSGDGLSYRYRWSRGGSAIPGATGNTLLVTASDFSTQLGCTITATGIYGTGTASTSVTMPTSCRCTPKVTKLAESHRTWRRGGRLARLSAAAKRPPVGTTFTFTLDRAATVVLSFTRTSNGRVVHHRCVPLTAANHSDRACTITKADGSMTFKAHAGVNSVSFQGRLSKKQRLATGNYLLGITAALTGGPTSTPSTLRFSIVS